MEEQKQAAQGSAATAEPSLKFSQMTGLQKTVFVFKLAVCILSFGFIFPKIGAD